MSINNFASISVIKSTINWVRDMPVVHGPSVVTVGGITHWSSVLVKKLAIPHRNWWDSERYFARAAKELNW